MKGRGQKVWVSKKKKELQFGARAGRHCEFRVTEPHSGCPWNPFLVEGVVYAPATVFIMVPILIIVINVKHLS